MVDFYKKAERLIKNGAPLMKISSLSVREDIIRIKTTIGNDELDKIIAIEKQMNDDFSAIERIYKKVDV